MIYHEKRRPKSPFIGSLRIYQPPPESLDPESLDPESLDPEPHPPPELDESEFDGSDLVSHEPPDSFGELSGVSAQLPPLSCPVEVWED